MGLKEVENLESLKAAGDHSSIRHGSPYFTRPLCSTFPHLLLQTYHFSVAISFVLGEVADLTKSETFPLFTTSMYSKKQIFTQILKPRAINFLDKDNTKTMLLLLLVVIKREINCFRLDISHSVEHSSSSHKHNAIYGHKFCF